MLGSPCITCFDGRIREEKQDLGAELPRAPLLDIDSHSRGCWAVRQASETEKELLNYNVKKRSMKWKKIDELHRIYYEGEYVSCSEPFERKFLIQAVSDAFPHLSRVRIAAMVDQCHKVHKAPVLRSVFVHFLQGYLD
jgi:hypothetical protein